MDENTLRLCEPPYSYQDWTTEEQFIRYIEYALPLLADIILFNGDISQKGSHDNIITGYNQTFAQHYDFPTAAVDVTRCYLVALHFAIDNGDIINSKCFSVYAYKQLDFSDESPCFLYNGDELKHNVRAQSQKGSFLFFRKPCTHYLETGEYPSLEMLINHRINYRLPLFADVIKFNIPYNTQIIEPLHLLLASNNINSQILKPDYAHLPILTRESSISDKKAFSLNR